MLIDTHVHLDKYSDPEVNSILFRAEAVGVGFVISAGTTIETSKRSIYLSGKYPNFFSGGGVHPMDLKRELGDSDYSHLIDLASSSEKVLVMSEIGLDFMEDMPDRRWQFDAFRKQIGIAKDFKLPIRLTSENIQDLLKIIDSNKPPEHMYM